MNSPCLNRPRCALPLACVAFALSLLHASTGRAQTQTDVLLDRFAPPPPGEYFAGLPFPRYNGDYYVVMRAGVVSRTTHAQPGTAIPDAARVTWQSVMHPMISLGVHNSVSVYAGMPVLLHNAGETGAVSSAARVGDPRFGVRLRFLNQASRAPWSFHIAGEFFLPAFWLNGIPADRFTGMSDGTVRGNAGLVGAGSVGLRDPRPPAIGNRFIWSAVTEENIRPEASALRPGSETHQALGAGLLFPGCGFRVTLEGHSWWRWDRIAQGWPGLTLEALVGVGVRLPNEFELVASGSVATASHGDLIVREGPVAGFTIGVAYAIRDWAAFPLAYDSAGSPAPPSREPAQPAFGAERPWDRDQDGLADDEDPCPHSRTEPVSEDRRWCPARLSIDENALLERRRGDVLEVTGLRLPVALAHPLVGEAPVDTNRDIVFHSSADFARLARTVGHETQRVHQLRIDALWDTLSRTSLQSRREEPFDPGVLTVYGTVNVQFADRLHPVLRASAQLRRAWIALQFARALREAGAVFDHVDALEPTPCRDDEPIDRVCLYLSVRTDPAPISPGFARDLHQLEQQGIQ